MLKIALSVVMFFIFNRIHDFTLTFPSQSAYHSNAYGDIKVSDPGVHLSIYGPFYVLLISSMLCSYFGGLACKLCVQVITLT